MADTAPEPILAEAGTSGLKQYGGYVREEWHPKLQGPDAVKIYREMSDNCAVVGGALNAIESLIRGVDFPVEPANESPEALVESDFVESCKNDMDCTWEDFVSEAMTMMTYGWSLHEEVYKIRRGEHENIPQLHSNHNDARFGWRSLAARPQDTLLMWDFDKNGRAIAMIQSALPDYKMRRIDFNRSLLFRPKSRKNNPEGWSMLRTAVRSYFKLKNTEDFESIGVERDLAGYPVMEVPPELLHPKADADKKAMLGTYQDMVQRIRRDQYEGTVIPSELDREGKPTGYRLRLLNSGGRRPVDVDAIIKRYESRILITLLCEFLVLGMDKVGSLALSSDKTDMFARALGALLDAFVAVMNRIAIPRLMRINAVPRELWPKLTHGDIEKDDVTKLVTNIAALSSAGAITLDDEIDAHLKRKLELPVKRRVLAPEMPPLEEAAA